MASLALTQQITTSITMLLYQTERIIILLNNSITAAEMVVLMKLMSQIVNICEDIRLPDIHASLAFHYEWVIHM